MDMIAAWIARIDADMAQALPATRLGNLPIRERIRSLVQFRLDAVAGREEALRRALAIMAMPQNAGRTARLSWSSADRMWRLAGDTAADFNHYTKRATLAALYGATLLVFVADESEGKGETRAFLDRRIAGVMRFEKAKARLLRPGRQLQPHPAARPAALSGELNRRVSRLRLMTSIKAVLIRLVHGQRRRRIAKDGRGGDRGRAY